MNETTLGRDPTPLFASDSSAVVHTSGVSWAAVFAGAAGAAALSLILLVLGVGLGLSSVSPWSTEGITATTFGVSTIVWLSFTQLAASGAGGYLAGRLRTRWAALHGDEVYFRDTAHGFLAWAIATLATAALLGSAVSAVVSGGVKAGATVAGGAATAAVAGAPMAAMAASGASDGSGPAAYYVDALFRPATTGAATLDSAASGAASAASAPEMSARPPSTASTESTAGVQGRVPAAEVGRIFSSAAMSGALPPEDARYVGRLVAERTGLPQAEAEKRVTDGFARAQAKAAEAETKAREAADTARKVSAKAALWTFVSLLIGAFIASLAATFGGRQRDLF